MLYDNVTDDNLKGILNFVNITEMELSW